MATVKRPAAPKAVEAPEQDTPTPEPEITEPKYGYHTVRGGVRYPIVRRYFDRVQNVVMDVYEKTRAVRARNPNTGNLEMVPGVKTRVSTYCRDEEVQHEELRKRGLTPDSDGKEDL